MSLEIRAAILKEIHAHGEATYPDEGAGLLLGTLNGENKRVEAILKLANGREAPARRTRYLLGPEDYLRGEEEAAHLGMDVLGVFHSHPDHPNRPSEFDREWALPVFSYLITGVWSGKAVESRSWQLAEDRSSFLEEPLSILGDG